GNLYVNRGITGAIVRRQPFGGWKRSVVGATAKAGGPNYLVHLGSWERAEAGTDAGVRLSDAVAAIVAAAGSARVSDVGATSGSGSGSASGAAGGFLERAARSDQAEWEREFGVAKDVSDLGVERDV